MTQEIIIVEIDGGLHQSYGVVPKSLLDFARREDRKGRDTHKVPENIIDEWRTIFKSLGWYFNEKITELVVNSGGHDIEALILEHSIAFTKEFDSVTHAINELSKSSQSFQVDEFYVKSYL